MLPFELGTAIFFVYCVLKALYQVTACKQICIKKLTYLLQLHCLKAYFSCDSEMSSRVYLGHLRTHRNPLSDTMVNTNLTFKFSSVQIVFIRSFHHSQM